MVAGADATVGEGGGGGLLDVGTAAFDAAVGALAAFAGAGAEAVAACCTDPAAALMRGTTVFREAGFSELVCCTT